MVSTSRSIILWDLCLDSSFPSAVFPIHVYFPPPFNAGLPGSISSYLLLGGHRSQISYKHYLPFNSFPSPITSSLYPTPSISTAISTSITSHRLSHRISRPPRRSDSHIQIDRPLRSSRSASWLISHLDTHFDFNWMVLRSFERARVWGWARPLCVSTRVLRERTRLHLGRGVYEDDAGWGSRLRAFRWFQTPELKSPSSSPPS